MRPLAITLGTALGAIALGRVARANPGGRRATAAKSPVASTPTAPSAPSPTPARPDADAAASLLLRRDEIIAVLRSRSTPPPVHLADDPNLLAHHLEILAEEKHSSRFVGDFTVAWLGILNHALGAAGEPPVQTAVRDDRAGAPPPGSSANPLETIETALAIISRIDRVLARAGVTMEAP